MTYARGCFANLPEGLGRGHIPSPRLDISRAWNFVFDHASVIGLAIAIAGIVIA